MRSMASEAGQACFLSSSLTSYIHHLHVMCILQHRRLLYAGQGSAGQCERLILPACAGLLEPSALSAVRTALQERALTAEVQTVRAHFQAAFAEEHQGLLAEIEHMQA